MAARQQFHAAPGHSLSSRADKLARRRGQRVALAKRRDPKPCCGLWSWACIPPRSSSRSAAKTWRSRIPAPSRDSRSSSNNGAGSRHLFPPAVSEGRDLGFRLIGYDRPGCGGSTAMPGRVIADCADDVRAIMSELGIAKTAVWGSSGGGPYALATAAELPGAVTAVCTFASIGPYGEPGLDFADGLGGDDFREEIRRKLEEPERAREYFRAQSAVTLAQRGSADWWLTNWGDRAGQDAAHSRERAEYLAACQRDVVRADDRGAFDDDGSWEDDLTFYKAWGFNLADIQAPVSLWHGTSARSRPSPKTTGFANRGLVAGIGVLLTLRCWYQ